MKRKILFSVIAVCILCLLCLHFFQKEIHPFIGSGTKSSPYQISTFDDLCRLSDMVNSGTSFENTYFSQTRNIDMQDIPFTPIGIYNGTSYFMGIYDGCGYYLENLNISYGHNNALFGKLGGTVMNLGIESGRVSGTCIGAIASHTSTRAAVIVNCYNKASVAAHRAGGIADNFNGSILNCWTDCELQASKDGVIGGIYSYGVAFQKNNIYSRNYKGTNVLSQENCNFYPNSPETVQQIIDELNASLYESATLAGVSATSLKKWKLDDAGNIILSQDNYQLTNQNKLDLIRVNMIYIIPAVFASLSLILLCVGFLKDPAKVKRAKENK